MTFKYVPNHCLECGFTIRDGRMYCDACRKQLESEGEIE